MPFLGTGLHRASCMLFWYNKWSKLRLVAMPWTSVCALPFRCSSLNNNEFMLFSRADRNRNVLAGVEKHLRSPAFLSCDICESSFVFFFVFELFCTLVRFLWRSVIALSSDSFVLWNPKRRQLHDTPAQPPSASHIPTIPSFVLQNLGNRHNGALSQ